jgi:FkbM family methyltransferase
MSPSFREVAAKLLERDYEAISYGRLATWGYRPAAIIDVGAYRGQWSLKARRIFGTIPTLMIEAQEGLLSNLEEIAASNENLLVTHALLGARDGQLVRFFEMGTGSSMFPETSNAPRTADRQLTQSLDQVVARRLGAVTNCFMKIDVQGAELEVLAGGHSVLSGCSLVQLELAMLQYNEGAPLLPEVVEWMARHDWLPIEVSGFSRPRDRLVQIDMLFAPTNSELRPTLFRF